MTMYPTRPHTRSTRLSAQPPDTTAANAEGVLTRSQRKRVNANAPLTAEETRISAAHTVSVNSKRPSLSSVNNIDSASSSVRNDIIDVTPARRRRSPTERLLSASVSNSDDDVFVTPPTKRPRTQAKKSITTAVTTTTTTVADTHVTSRVLRSENATDLATVGIIVGAAHTSIVYALAISKL